MTPRPRGTCSDCGQDVPLRKDGTPCQHTIGRGPYAPGESREYCDHWTAKMHRTGELLRAVREAYFKHLG